MSDAPNIIKKSKYMPGFGVASAASNPDNTSYGNTLDYSYPRVQDVMDLDSKNFKYGYEYKSRSDMVNDFFYQDPLFLSFDILLDSINSPLLTTDVTKGSLSSFFEKYGTIPSISNRLKVYLEFKDILTRLFNVNHHTIDKNKSYYINSIAGLDKLSAKIVDYQKDKITITLNDDVTMISSFLSSLYNNLCYSYKDQRFIIPQNLLRFNMYLQISDMRNMPMLDISSGGEVNKTFIKSSIVYFLRDCNFDFFESRNFDDTLTAGGFDAGRLDKITNLKFDIYYKSIEHEIYNPFIGGEEKLNNKTTTIFIPGEDDLNIHSVFNGNIKENEDIDKLSRLINDVSVSNFLKKNKKDPTKELDGITDQFKSSNQEDLDQRNKTINGSKNSFSNSNLNFINDFELEQKRKSIIKEFIDSTDENPQYFNNQASERMAIMNMDTGLVDDSNNMFSEIDIELSRSYKLRRALMSELFVDNLRTVPLRVGDIFYDSLNHYRYDVLNKVNENQYASEIKNNELNGDEIPQELKSKLIHDVWKIDTQFLDKKEKDLGKIISEISKENKKIELGNLEYDTQKSTSFDEFYIDIVPPESKNENLGKIDMSFRKFSEFENIQLYGESNKKIISDLGKLNYAVRNPHIVSLGDLYENSSKKTISNLGKIDQSFETHDVNMGKIDQSFIEKTPLNLEKIDLEIKAFPITELGALYSNYYNPRIFDLGVLFKDVEKNNILELTYLYSKFEKFKYLEDLRLYNNFIGSTKILNKIYVDQTFNKSKSFNDMVYLYDGEINIKKTLENLALYNNDINKENNLNFEKLYENSIRKKEFDNIVLYDNSSKRVDSIQKEYLYFSEMKEKSFVDLGKIESVSIEEKKNMEPVFLYDENSSREILEKEYLYDNEVGKIDVELGKLYEKDSEKTGSEDFQKSSKSSYVLGYAEYDLKKELNESNRIDLSYEPKTLDRTKIYESSFEPKRGLGEEKIEMGIQDENKKESMQEYRIFDSDEISKKDSLRYDLDNIQVEKKHLDSSLNDYNIFNSKTYSETKDVNLGTIDLSTANKNNVLEEEYIYDESPEKNKFKNENPNEENDFIKKQKRSELNGENIENNNKIE